MRWKLLFRGRVQDLSLGFGSLVLVVQVWGKCMTTKFSDPSGLLGV